MVNDKTLELIEKILRNIEKVIIGKRGEVLNIMKGILANGHVLIEDVPGVGKTMLVKTIAKTMDLSFSRIQFTPDLLPTDILGVAIYNQNSKEFEFKKGPVFSNIVLADEINRTSPKTQSALLEAMEEKQISDGSTTYYLKEPFIVFATENPIEYEGTFPLPEAQLDRFIIKASMGYPDKYSETKILKTFKESNPIEYIYPVCGAEDILYLQDMVRKVTVRDELYNYIVDIVNKTRENEMIKVGGSIRASLALMRVAQANAIIEGRDYVIPYDIKGNVFSVMTHRIVLTSLAKSRGYTPEQVLEEILNNTIMPRVYES